MGANICEYGLCRNRVIEKLFLYVARNKRKILDVLIVHSVGDLKSAINLTDWLHEHCKIFGVKLYIAHNDALLSEDEFIL